MRLPFTTDQFLDVFAAYNQAIWPAQVVAYVAGLGALSWALAMPSRASAAALGLTLACMWVLMGAGYHIGFFQVINPLALPAGALFILQGGLTAGVALRGGFQLSTGRTGWKTLGLVLAACGTVIYPLLGSALGHVYPRAPVFGVAPCPTTIFTLGIFLLAARPLPRWLFIVPVLWSLVGASAAFLLGVREDLMLPLAGAAGVIAAVARGRRPGTPEASTS
jgi:hypothetical protein